MDSLRTINLDEKFFICDGRKFIIKDSLSFRRYKELQKINLEFGFSTTFHDLYNGLLKLQELMNGVKFFESAVLINNLLLGIATSEDKYEPALRMCALFIDEEGEDPTIYDEGKQRDKIDCWSKELDVLPFFVLAANLVPGWISASKKHFPAGTEADETEK